MKMLAWLVLAVSATSVASAEPMVSMSTPKGMLLVHFEDDTGALAKLVGKDKKGVVRCYTAADKIAATHGQAISGCYVGITRDGQLVAPPADKRWTDDHLVGLDDGGLRIEKLKKPDELGLTITDNAGSAIGLWVDCDAKPKGVTCDIDHGMAGKYNWEISFVVTKGGGVRAAP
jgi:hypothetical protein